MKTLLLIFLAGAAFLAGCEDNNTPESFRDGPNVSALSITPSAATISPTNTYAVFEARGGMGPFSWSVSDNTLGSVPATTASLATYTREDSVYGANMVSVQDANGWTASAEVWQPETVNPE